jgi:hypothetical protein
MRWAGADLLLQRAGYLTSGLLNCAALTIATKSTVAIVSDLEPVPGVDFTAGVLSSIASFVEILCTQLIPDADETGPGSQEGYASMLSELAGTASGLIAVWTAYADKTKETTAILSMIDLSFTVAGGVLGKLTASQMPVRADFVTIYTNNV